MRTRAAWTIAAVCILVASDGRAQGLTGALLGTVTDEQGAVPGRACAPEFSVVDWRASHDRHERARAAAVPGPGPAPTPSTSSFRGLRLYTKKASRSAPARLYRGP